MQNGDTISPRSCSIAGLQNSVTQVKHHQANEIISNNNHRNRTVLLGVLHAGRRRASRHLYLVACMVLPCTLHREPHHQDDRQGERKELTKGSCSQEPGRRLISAIQSITRVKRCEAYKPDRKLLYLLSCLVRSRMSHDVCFHVFVLCFSCYVSECRRPWRSSALF